MTTKDEALRIALEALEEACGNRCNAEYNPCYAREAITAIKQAQQAQEPVAWRIWDDQEGIEPRAPRWQYYDRTDFKEGVHPDKVFAKVKSEALYGAPPKPAPQRQPLTDAAPDLLAALKDAVDRQAYQDGRGPEWWENARAAIAKATGGAA